MKADAKFRYSDRAWCALKREAMRVCLSKGDPDQITLRRAGVAILLRTELENLGQKYGSPPPRQMTETEMWNFADAKWKAALRFKKSVIVAGQLPAPLQARSAAVVSEITSHYTNQLEDFAGKRLKPMSRKNAKKRHLDAYFKRLRAAWLAIGGRRASAKPGMLKAFIQAAAQPVIGPESTTIGAIEQRLQRLYRK